MHSRGKNSCQKTADSVDIETKRMYLCIALRVLPPEPELSDNSFITEGCSNIPLEKLHNSSSLKESAILHMKLAQGARTFYSSALPHLLLFAVSFQDARNLHFQAKGAEASTQTGINGFYPKTERPTEQLRKECKGEIIAFFPLLLILISCITMGWNNFKTYRSVKI